MLFHCKMCGGDFPGDQFYIRPTGKPWRLRCRACWSKVRAATGMLDKALARYAANREASKEYRRQLRSRRKDRQGWKTDPALLERKRVGDRLRRAVHDGRIIKPDTCQDCGNGQPKGRLHAHHADYSKPFDVSWLCAGCHGKRHRRERTTA